MAVTPHDAADRVAREFRAEVPRGFDAFHRAIQRSKHTPRFLRPMAWIYASWWWLLAWINGGILLALGALALAWSDKDAAGLSLIVLCLVGQLYEMAYKAHVGRIYSYVNGYMHGCEEVLVKVGERDDRTGREVMQ